MKTDIRDKLKAISEELDGTLEGLREDQLEALEGAIISADKIFVAGAGRSLMMIRGLAMRLMHFGRDAYVVGETVTPAITPWDLLIIASGSGSTGTLTVIAGNCKRIGADLALITTRPDSPIGDLADVVVEVSAVSTKVEGSMKKSVQPGSSTFEESVLLICDAIVADLTENEDPKEANRELMSRHANLE